MAREAGRWPGHNRACAACSWRAGPQARRARRRRAPRPPSRSRRASRSRPWTPLLRGARERRETSDYPRRQSLLAQRDETLDKLGAAGRDQRRGNGWVLRARIHLHQGQLDDVFRWAEPRRGRRRPAGWTATRAEAVCASSGDAARRRGDLDRSGGALRALRSRSEEPRTAWRRASGDWPTCCASSGRPGPGPRAVRPLRAALRGDRRRARRGRPPDRPGRLARQRRRPRGGRNLYGKARDAFRGAGQPVRRLPQPQRPRRGRPPARDLARAGGLYLQSLGILERLSSADGLFPRVNLALVDLGGGRFARGAGRTGRDPRSARRPGLGRPPRLRPRRPARLRRARTAPGEPGRASFGRLSELLSGERPSRPRYRLGAPSCPRSCAEEAGREAWARAARGLKGADTGPDAGN